MGCGASAQNVKLARYERLKAIRDKVRSKVDELGKDVDGQEKVVKVFKQWDIDSSGGISVNELLRVFAECKANVEERDVRILWSLTDANTDNKIDLQEFIDWLYKEDESSTVLPRSPSGTWPARAPSTPLMKTGDSTEALLPPPDRTEPLIVFLHSAVALPGGVKECSPDVVAYVKKTDKIVGPKVSWHAFKHNNNPCWNTARDLGCQTMGHGADEKNELHLEVWITVDKMLKESHVLLGEISLRLADIVPDQWHDEPLKLTAKVEQNKAAKAPSLRFMIMSEPPLVKKIFLVRHAESEWNKAQREKNISALLEQVDHPLTEDGLKQCKQLQEKISGKGRELSPKEAELLDAQLILSSPLTRAIETALIGLHPILAKLKSLRLMANAREKRNLGGRDTSGSAKGVAETFLRLRNVLKSHGESGDEIDRYLAVDVDTTEADNKWWNDSKESSSAVKERLDEFLRQLRYLREERIVVVGHSHFFRTLLQQRMHSSATILRVSRQDICKKKVENCSILAVTLDFRRGSDRPITEVEFVLDTGLEAKHAKNSKA